MKDENHTSDVHATIPAPVSCTNEKRHTIHATGRYGLMLTLLLALVNSFGVSVLAAPSANDDTKWWQQETLTGDWGGTRSALAENGLSLNMGLTHVYQQNTHDGMEQGVGKGAATYDIELEADLETLLGIPSATFFVHGEGSTTADAGLDARAVNSLFGVNGDLGGERTLDIVEYWYQQNFFADRLRIRIGKLDMTGGFQCRACPVSFDGNRFANDETSQFLNGALVNNPAIPFPDYGMGIVVYAEPTNGWYFSAGAADAEADPHTAGFDTVFDGDSDFFYAMETGVVPVLNLWQQNLQGAYRIGAWHEEIARPRLGNPGVENDNTGFYLSFDQTLYRERAESSQGVGVFVRSSIADDDVNPVDTFASAGFQYKGLIPGRDADTLGMAWAYTELSDNGGFTASYEQVAEMYYNIQVTPWMSVSPDVQLVDNPGGSSAGGEALVVGVRSQLTF